MRRRIFNLQVKKLKNDKKLINLMVKVSSNYPKCTFINNFLY
jgi:hypothetical protein